MLQKIIVYQKELFVDENGNVYKPNGEKYNQRSYKEGYLYIPIKANDGKPHNLLVHRLVAQAFLNCHKNFDKYDVHHIDGNKHNNKVQNLKIMDKKEHKILHNQKYPLTKICAVCGKEFTPKPTKRKRAVVCSNECKRKLDKIHAKSRQRRINQYTLDNVFIRTWDSEQEIENTLGYSGSNICACCRGRIKRIYGYVWKYAE